MKKDEYIKSLLQLNNDEFIQEIKSIIIKSHFDINVPKWKQELLFDDLDDEKQKLLQQAVYEAYSYIELLESDIFRKSTDIPINFDRLNEVEIELIEKFFKSNKINNYAFENSGESLSKILDLENHKMLFARVSGNSMIGANLNDNDIIIIDTSSKPINGDIVLINLGGEFIVKRLKIINTEIYFVSENAEMPPYKIDFAGDFRIIGVVKYYIKSVE